MGYVAINAAAQRLNLAVGDFGFTFRDYLFLPGLIYLLVIVGGVLFEFQDRWNSTYWGVDGPLWFKVSNLLVRMAVGVGLAMGYIFSAAALAAASGFGTLLVVPVIGLPALVPVLWKRSRMVGGMLAALLVILGGVLTILASITWADSVADYARTGEDPPSSLLSPGYALNPRTGELCVGGDCACRVRLAPNVFGSPQGFTVVEAIERFTPEECSPED